MTIYKEETACGRARKAAVLLLGAFAYALLFALCSQIDQCGETALGTGMFSEFFAGAADFFGTTSNKFADKLETAKNYAISALQEKVRNAGANAIIGLDVDYNMFMSNLIGVIALSPLVYRITKNYVDRQLKGKKVEPVLSNWMDIQDEAADAVKAESE